jgi:hypothetical protein
LEAARSPTTDERIKKMWYIVETIPIIRGWGNKGKWWRR